MHGDRRINRRLLNSHTPGLESLTRFTCSGSQCSYPTKIQPRGKLHPQSSKLRHSRGQAPRDLTTDPKWQCVWESPEGSAGERGLMHQPPLVLQLRKHTVVKAKEERLRETVSRRRTCHAHYDSGASSPRSGASSVVQHAQEQLLEGVDGL